MAELEVEDEEGETGYHHEFQVSHYTFLEASFFSQFTAYFLIFPIALFYYFFCCSVSKTKGLISMILLVLGMTPTRIRIDSTMHCLVSNASS